MYIPFKLFTVYINGSAEIKIGFYGSILSWNFTNKLSFELDEVTNRATFSNARMEFCMEVNWKGNVPGSLHSKIIVDEDSKRILGFTVPPPPSSKPLVIKSVSSSDSLQASHSRGPRIHDARPPPPPPPPVGTARRQQSRPLPGIIKQPVMRYLGIAQDRDNELLGQERIHVIEDVGVGTYRSLLVGEDVDGATYVLPSYVDVPLDPRVRVAIQAKIDQRDRGTNEPAFGVSPFLGTVVSKAEARRVVPCSGDIHPDSWVSSTVMDVYQQLLSNVPHARVSNIHHHPDYISVELYSALQIGELHNKAIEIAGRDALLHVMSTCYLSTMLINLYNDHWFLLVFNLHLKSIHCINTLDTSAGMVKMLLRLLHVYLWAHDVMDADFHFNPSEWSFCVIREDRIPSQRGNGTECGPMSLRCLEYLVAGQPLTFTLDTMWDYRFKILVAIRLREIPWLTRPGVAMDAVETVRAINEYVPRVDQARRGGGRVGVVETEEEKRLRTEAKETRKKLKQLLDKGEVDLTQVWENVVYDFT